MVELMSHTYPHNLLHCVFSTKQRQSLIRNPEELWHYVAALGHAKGIHVLAAGGMQDHLHVLILLPQTITLATAMREIKANSSRWLREASSTFQWQEGYGIQREPIATASGDRIHLKPASTSSEAQF